MPKAKAQVTRVSKRLACFMELSIEADEILEEGSKRMIPDTINVQWGRVDDSPWRILSVSTAGNRVIKPRGGVPEVTDQRIVFSYEELDFVPRWIMNAVKSNIPSRA